MNRLTCAQAEEHLELFALDECPEPVRSAVAGHVAACPHCRQSLSQTRQILGLLDLQHQETDRLQRLFAALDKVRPTVPIRKRVLHFPRQLAALAALLMLALGLAWVTPPSTDAQVEVIVPGRDSVRNAPATLQASEMKRVRERAVIWTSPQHPGQPVEGTVKLTAGVLWVRVDSGPPGSIPFRVQTPRAHLTSAGGAFVVESRPSADVVTILEGGAQLTNARGTVSGGPGDVLGVPSQGPPHRLGKTGP
jgi:ferric-dicitrate binding protein FerR (iron transport regulator)